MTYTCWEAELSYSCYTSVKKNVKPGIVVCKRLRQEDGEFETIQHSQLEDSLAYIIRSCFK